MARTILAIIPTIIRVELPDDAPLHVLDVETTLNGLYRHPVSNGTPVFNGQDLGESLTAKSLAFNTPKVLSVTDAAGQSIYNAKFDDPRIAY